MASWWFGTFCFFHILGMSSSFIFFRGVGQPPTRWRRYAWTLFTTLWFDRKCKWSPSTEPLGRRSCLLCKDLEWEDHADWHGWEDEGNLFRSICKWADMVLMSLCSFVVVEIRVTEQAFELLLAFPVAVKEKCTKGTTKGQFYLPNWNECLGWWINRVELVSTNIDQHGRGLPAPMNESLVFKAPISWLKIETGIWQHRKWVGCTAKIDKRWPGRFLHAWTVRGTLTSGSVDGQALKMGRTDLIANRETLHWKFFAGARCWNLMEFEFRSCWVGGGLCLLVQCSFRHFRQCLRRWTALNIVEPFLSWGFGREPLRKLQSTPSNPNMGWPAVVTAGFDRLICRFLIRKQGLCSAVTVCIDSPYVAIQFPGHKVIAFWYRFDKLLLCISLYHIFFHSLFACLPVCLLACSPARLLACLPACLPACLLACLALFTVCQ